MKVQEIQNKLDAILRGETIHDSNQPKDKPALGEVVVGTIDDPITRSLWSFAQQIDDYQQDYLATQSPTSPQSFEEFFVKADESYRVILCISQMLNAVTGCFWARVHERYPETASMRVHSGIREGFQLVLWKKEGQPSMILEVVRKAADAQKEGVAT